MFIFDRHNLTPHHTLDTVLLKPQLSSGQSRKNNSVKTLLSHKPHYYMQQQQVIRPSGPHELLLDVPIISANMDTVTGLEMAKVMCSIGAGAFLHRYEDPTIVIDQVKQLYKYRDKLLEEKNIKDLTAFNIIPSIGIHNNPVEYASSLLAAGADGICIDIAHGHSELVINLVKVLNETLPSIHIIVGNIGTYEAAADLIEAGANALKVGIGNGKACLTRDQTGAGVPQLWAVSEVRRCVDNLHKYGDYHRVAVIADGGIRNSGDIVKLLAAGADSVMSGYLFAGCRESEGFQKGFINPSIYGGPKSVEYRGMASREAQEDFKGNSKNIEGARLEVGIKGTAKTIVQNLVEGVQSGMSYCGARTIAELQEKAEFISTI